jgi:hypothetical protein
MQKEMSDKCPHGLEVQNIAEIYSHENGTYCASCLAEALQDGSLGIDIGYSKKQRKAMKDIIKNSDLGSTVNFNLPEKVKA